ncbi:unnamed protein product [Jaminaea pallidilutea]
MMQSEGSHAKTTTKAHEIFVETTYFDSTSLSPHLNPNSLRCSTWAIRHASGRSRRANGRTSRTVGKTASLHSVDI